MPGGKSKRRPTVRTIFEKLFISEGNQVSMKAIIASGLLVIATYGANYALEGCESRPANPPSVIEVYSISDGIWVVGKDIPAGLWSFQSYWRELPDCKWFVTPSTDPSPGASPSYPPDGSQYRDNSVGAVAVQLHIGEGLVIDNCDPARWTWGGN